MLEVNAMGIVIALLYVVTRAVRNRMSSYRIREWQKRLNTVDSARQKEKKVVVIVCCYGKVHPELFASIAAQQFAGDKSVEVIVVDDGSPNVKELQEKFYRKYENRLGWTFIRKENGGKKDAQHCAIASRQWNAEDLILFLDADTQIPNSQVISSLIAGLENHRIGGVGARLNVSNPHKSWITQFLVEEYNQTYRAKEVESFYEMVTVVSGACSMWKWKVIDEIFDRYLAGPDTGDENTLSYLALRTGYGTSIVPAIAETEVPVTLKKLVIQQVRWLRSDCLYLGKNYRLLLNRKKSFLLFNMTVEFISPLLLLFSAASCILQGAFGAVSSAILELVFLLFMMTFDVTSAWKTATSVGKKRLRFSLLYPVHVLLFSLIRVWALFTCKREVWISH